MIDVKAKALEEEKDQMRKKVEKKRREIGCIKKLSSHYFRQKVP